MLNFNAQGRKGNKHLNCSYVDVYDRKEEWVNEIIHLKNVGKSNIDSYYLLTLRKIKIANCNHI